MLFQYLLKPHSTYLGSYDALHCNCQYSFGYIGIAQELNDSLRKEVVSISMSRYTNSLTVLYTNKESLKKSSLMVYM